MKTLIINGSPRKNGDTEILVKEFAKYLCGEVTVISHKDEIAPCSDCRHCQSNTGCSVQDRMQNIYPLLQECDNIVLASPIWFSSLSGPLLNMCSRIQTFCASGYFRNESLQIKQKSGVLILVGAEKGTEIIPTQNALTIMKFMNVHRPSVEKIYSLNTNNIPTKKDNPALKKCRTVAELLNSKYCAAKCHEVSTTYS